MQVFDANKQPVLGAVALGANLPSAVGAPAETLAAAIEALENELKLVRVSRFFATPAFPAGMGPDYVNAAFTFESKDSPAAVLDILHRIEARFGRVRGERWGARVIDLDLLFLGQTVCPNATVQGTWRNLPPQERLHAVPDQLVLPHPRLQDRSFVLVPLLDIAPDWRHPLLGQTVQEMTANLPPEALEEVRPLTNSPLVKAQE